MKAVAVVPGKREVRLIDQEPPRLGSPTEVALRMLEVGVCGTDREICAFQYGTPPAGAEHLVIGHESLGQVVEVGPQVTRLEPGDLVVTMVRRPCSHAECVACRAGRQDFCFTGDFSERGIKNLHGFMTERVVDDERWMHRVPPALRDVAVLVEPLTIAEKALIQVDQVQQRLPWACAVEPGKPRTACHRAVVLGAGPVGLLGAMALAAAGYDTSVYSRERAPNPKADLVAAIGGHYYSAEETSIERLAEEVRNIDLVYEATGASSIAFQVMEVIGTNGVFVFTGVPGRKAPIEVDTDVIMRNLVLKNQVVFGTVNAGHEAFAAAIRDLTVFQQRWPAALRALITGRFPVEAYRDLLVGPARGIKNVLTFA
ncbi:MAG TPA: glucose 1-dehydrogenase [Candidatus Limnocylindria bacterium]|nr:glucose 1-dehydrogenase [Candidatus Limnocylindria bacterium]